MEEHIYSNAPIQWVQIAVDKLHLRCYIGFNDWEKHKLQDVLIDYRFAFNAQRALHSDDPTLTDDYKTLNKSIIRRVDGQSFQLLESLAEEVYRLIKSNPYRAQVWVRVSKPHALRFADNVAAIIDDQMRPNQAVIALGSNIEPEKHIHQAHCELSRLGLILQKTEILRTKPQKFTDQPDFLNTAVLLATYLPLEELQLHLRQIETHLGRVRTQNKNAPRTIDLDITTFNDHIIDEEGVREFDFLRHFLKALQPHLADQIEKYA